MPARVVPLETGITTTFGLKNAEERGSLFYEAGAEVYAGMVIGEHQRPGDLDVNVCKKKHLTNMRAANADIEIRLTPPRRLSLDDAIEYLSDDELLEVTPENYRIRKRILSAHERGKMVKNAKKAALVTAWEVNNVGLIWDMSHPKFNLQIQIWLNGD